MAGQLAGQPIYILREGSQRTKEKNSSNVKKAHTIHETITLIS